jgi:hypothetical protein
VPIKAYITIFPRYKGFTLKVLPEGTGVRLLYTNQIQTEPIIKYQVMSYQFSVMGRGVTDCFAPIASGLAMTGREGMDSSLRQNDRDRERLSSPRE